MILVHNFHSGMPLYWPDNHEQETYWIDDGVDDVLLVRYTDKCSRVSPSFWTPKQVKENWQSEHEYLSKKGKLE